MSMDVGMSMGQATGGSAEVVGRAGSDLVGAVGRMTFISSLIEMSRPAPVAMVVGMPLTDATGQRVELVSRPGGPLAGMVESVLLPIAALSVIGALVQSNTAPPPTQDEMRAQAAAQDQQRLTALAEEDQLKAQSLAEEERRKAYFSKPKM